MEERSALKRMVIEHYERMIKWVKKQIPTDPVSYNKMVDTIKESWAGIFCPLCNIYREDCFGCPVDNHTIGDGCSNTPWEEIDDAKTWAEWLLAAEKELKFLERLDF